MNDKLLFSSKGIYITKKINVSDTVRISENMASINSVIFSKITPSVSENIVSGKMLSYSGNCNVEMLYVSESGTYDRISVLIPFEMTEPCDYEKGTFFGKCELSEYEITPIKGRRCDVSICLEVSGYIFLDEEITTEFNSGEYRIYKDESTADTSRTSVLSIKDSYEYVHESGFSDGVKIIYADAEVYDLKTNHSSAGVLVNGFIKQNILYSHLGDDDTYTFHIIEESVAFSKFCEVPYNVSFSEYFASCKISSVDAYADERSGEVVICLDASLTGEIFLISNEKISYINDIFSPDIDIKCDFIKKKCSEITKIQQKDIEITLSSSVKHNIFPAVVVAGKENVNVGFMNKNDNSELYIRVEAETILLSNEDNTFKIIKGDSQQFVSLVFTADTAVEYFTTYTVTDVIRNLTDSEVKTVLKLNMEVYGISTCGINVIGKYTTAEYENCDNDFITVNIHYPSEDISCFELAKMNRRSPEEIKELINKQSEDVQGSGIVIWSN